MERKEVAIQTEKQPEQKPLPADIIEFIAAFMRALNTARLYARGHDLLKQQTQQLFSRFGQATKKRDFLFLGCARNAFFLEGSFYQAKDVHLVNFLKFFHALRISHVLLEKEITTDELESFLGLLAGARQGQGNEVSAALSRENINHARLGLLNYTVFSTVQTVATRLTQTSGDEAIWRQLIIQPAGAGAFNLSTEQTGQIIKLSENMEELKKIIRELATDMTKNQQEVSIAQRGVLLENFIQNIGDTLAGIDPEKRKRFPLHAGKVLDSLEPELKTHILGAAAPDSAGKKRGGVIHEIFQSLTDTQTLYLLVDTLKDAGAKSLSFSNLFNRALNKYREPDILLALVRQEMHRSTQAGKTGKLKHWQHLEQHLVQEQETKELNEQYHKEIEALATSINMKVPMVEEEEMGRLIKTLSPDALELSRAELIVHLINQHHTTFGEAFPPSLIESLRETLRHLLGQGKFRTVGTMLRTAFLAISDYPDDAVAGETMASLLSAEDIRSLVNSLLAQCRSYDSRETAAIDTICQLYPERAGAFLLDTLLEIKDRDGAQARWLTTILATLGRDLTRVLIRRLQGSASDQALSQLLALAAATGDSDLGTAVGRHLDHRNHDIRARAAAALGKLGSEQAVPRLAEIALQKSLVRTKKRKSLQRAAILALAEINTDRAREAMKTVISQGPGDLRKLCEELM